MYIFLYTIPITALITDSNKYLLSVGELEFDVYFTENVKYHPLGLSRWGNLITRKYIKIVHVYLRKYSQRVSNNALMNNERKKYCLFGREISPRQMECQGYAYAGKGLFRVSRLKREKDR